MAEIFVERRELVKGTTLSWDLAHHLYMRQQNRPIAIFSENPQATLAALRKQWVKLIAKVKKEYSSTLDIEKREHLLCVIDGMESLSFGTKAREASAVTVLEAQELALCTGCLTVYDTCDLDIRLIFQIEHLMRKDGLLVRYAKVKG